jgi:RTX calcium-binding nonapeptide repeat (4 copies)
MGGADSSLLRRTCLVISLGLLIAGVAPSAAGARFVDGTTRGDRLRGSASNDVIRARAGADRVHGRAGADVLAGGAGNDLLSGGAGRDRISCGAGRDRVFADSSDWIAADCERIVGAVRGPGGRIFPAGAVFSAGVSGGNGGARAVGAVAQQVSSLVRVSTDAGVSAPLQDWERATSGQVFLDSQTEPWVDINPADRSNVVGFWQEDRWSSGGARNLVFGTSFDGGASWANIPLQGVSRLAGGAYERVTDPWLDFGPNNRVHATSLAFDDTFPFKNAIFVHTSTDGGLTWGPPVTVIADTEFQFFNDKQALVADDFTTSPFRGNVYVAWDRLEERATGQPVTGEFTGPAYFSRSTNGGASFSPPQVIFGTGVNKQTLGNVPIVLPDIAGTAANDAGMVVVGGTYFKSAGFSAEKNIAFFYVVRSTDGGVTWSAPIIVDHERPLVVPNVRSGDTVPSLAVDRRTGKLYAAWQDSRFSKGSENRNDILVISSSDGGLTWSAPIKANDTPPGAQDAFTPTIQVDDGGRVGVLYYDLRDDSDPKDAAIMTAEWLTVSTDGGRTFGPSQRLTPAFDQTAAAFAGGYFLGDYQGLGNAGTAFQPLFVANLVAQANGELGSDVFSTQAP